MKSLNIYPELKKGSIFHYEVYCEADFKVEVLEEADEHDIVKIRIFDDAYDCGIECEEIRLKSQSVYDLIFLGFCIDEMGND